MIKLVDLEKQESPILAEILSAIREEAQAKDFILGRAVSDFEKHFASYMGSRYCIGTGSGGSALTLALKALGVKRGDEVITQTNSYIATAFSALYLGATPILVDVNPSTFQIDAEKIEAAISPRTKGIIVVHLYGYAAPMKEIQEIALRHQLWILEDAAHAHGAMYEGKRCGSLGIAGAFSFYPAKNLGCWGDGGAVISNDQKIFETARLFRGYGEKSKNYHTAIGMNSRLDSLQAAILDVKLKKLDLWNEERYSAARCYCRWFKEFGLDPHVVLPPLEIPGQRPSFHLFVIRVKNGRRDALREYLSSKGVETGIHYPIPIHLQPATSFLGYKRGAFPVAEEFAQSILSLPMHGGLEESGCRMIAAWVKEFFELH